MLWGKKQGTKSFVLNGQFCLATPDKEMSPIQICPQGAFLLRYQHQFSEYTHAITTDAGRQRCLKLLACTLCYLYAEMVDKRSLLFKLPLLVVSLLIGIQLVEDRMNKYIFLLWKVAAINTGKRQCAQRIGFL